MMKRLLSLCLGIFVCGLASAQIAPKVEVVANIGAYKGNAPKVYSRSDSKWYALNNLGNYEEYGVIVQANTTKVAQTVAEKQIEYIETLPSMRGEGKTPYIATDYIPKANTRVTMDFSISEDSKAWQALFGARQGAWTSHAFVMFAHTGKDGGAYRGCWNRTNDEHVGDTEIPREERIVLNGYRSEMIMNYYNPSYSDVIEYEEEGPDEFYYCPNEGDVEDCTNALFFFDTNTAGAGGKQADNSFIIMKLYGAKLYEVTDEGENVLVADFVPYQFTDGQCGLKDLVSGESYKSARLADGGLGFAGSDDAAVVDGVTAYDGKIIQVDGNYYQYENGAYVLKAGVELQPIEDNAYQDMNNWATNEGHASCFGEIISDGEGNNRITNYHGIGGHEPFAVSIPTEKGARYKYSFSFSCPEWSSWNVPNYMHAVVLTNYDDGLSDLCANLGGDRDILATVELPHEESYDYPVVLEFTADASKEWLLNQFGYVDDDHDYWFEFNDILVEKYVENDNMPSYEALEIPEDHMVFETMADAEAYASLFDGQYFYVAENGFNTYKVTTAGAELVTERTDLPFEGVEPVSGESYYLINVDAKNYPWLQHNNRVDGDWTTRAQLGEYGFDLKLIYNEEEDAYQIDPKFGNNHSINGSNDLFYLDTGRAISYWKFRPVVKDGVTAYVITCGNNVLSANEEEILSENANGRALWQIVTKEDRLEALKSATVDKPANASWLLGDVEFANANDRRNLYWTIDAAGGNTVNSGDGGVRANRVLESWNSDYFDMYQAIDAEVPNGVYEFSLQGYYRDGSVGVDGYYNYEDDMETLRAIYYINDAEGVLKSIYSEAQDESKDGFYYELGEGEGEDFLSIGKFVPNSTDNASLAIWRGYYKNEPLTVEVEDGIIEVGITKTEGVGGDWIIIDRLQLLYKGDGTTGIETVNTEADAKTVKNSSVYTISGVKVNGKNLQKGIYIIDGKKQVVK